MSNEEILNNQVILQKYIALSGYCSRRQAESLIRDKKVKLNGRTAELGVTVARDDKVEVEGKTIGKPAAKIYIILNKPAGYTCTTRKFKNEKNIFDLLKINERLFMVGRLDKESRGLLLLTNDGDLAQSMTHPKFGHEKEYLVEIFNFQFSIFNENANTNSILKKLISGVDIGEGDGVVKAKKVEYIGNSKFRIILTEGKKRQIRRMFKKLGYEVADLLRVRIGDIELGGLKEGGWKEISSRSIKL